MARVPASHLSGAAAPASRVLLVAADAVEASRLQTRVGAGFEVVHCPADIDSLLSALHEPVQAAVVLFDARKDLAKSVELAQWLRRYKTALPVLAMGHAHTAQVPLAALRAGVLDFLDASSDADDALEPLWSACARQGSNRRGQGKGHCVALVGARAGMGVTTLATHLAAVLSDWSSSWRTSKHKEDAAAQDSDRDLGVALLDLGFPLKDAQMLLGIPSGLHMVDCIQGAHRLDRAMLASALERDAHGVAVLSWPAHVAQLRDVDAASVGAMVQQLRDFYAWQVIDLGAFPSPDIVQSVMREADHVWAVCDQSLGGIVSLTEWLRELPVQEGYQAWCHGLVLNRWHREAGMSASDIARRMQLPLLQALPSREAELLQASSAGQLLHQAMPNDVYCQGVKALAARLVDPVSGRQVAQVLAAPDKGLGLTSWWQKVRGTA